MYLPYENPDLPGQVVEKLFTELGSKGNLIARCDANAYHLQWGSKDINARGESILRFILSFFFLIYIRGNEATFQNKDRVEVIDFTFTNVAESLIHTQTHTLKLVPAVSASNVDDSVNFIIKVL